MRKNETRPITSAEAHKIGMMINVDDSSIEYRRKLVNSEFTYYAYEYSTFLVSGSMEEVAGFINEYLS